MIPVKPQGPVPARIMIVGEAPGVEEERTGVPFVGASGQEMNRMLGEAGITRTECFVTNVCRIRPPNNDINQFFAKSKKDRTKEHTEVKGRFVRQPILEGLSLLQKEIESVRPNVILALGNTPLWALCGRWGITKWRGSMLYSDDSFRTKIKVIPTYHPAAILRQWEWRAVGVNDFRRAKRFIDGTPYPEPKWNFKIRPSYEESIQCLDQLFIRAAHREPLRLAFDLETRAGHIACAGVAWSRNDAICIPFMCTERREGYWNDIEQEAQVTWRLYQLLNHPNVRVVGQNLLYDAQYTWKHWRFVPHITQDTMISQHSVFSALPKSLAFLASMYCDYYVYWKDEGKDWASGMGEDQLWHYNCEDCVYTYEVSVELERLCNTFWDRSKLVHESQQALFWPVLYAMQRGVRVDTEKRKVLTQEVEAAIQKRQEFLLEVLGHPLNPASPKQMHNLFYHDFGMPVQMKRATKSASAKPTLDDQALQKLAKYEPLLKPIINAICDIRTLEKFLSNFLYRELSEDGRMRCSYNIGGSASGASAPVTYRLSSSEDAFGSGANLQTIPSAKSKSMGKAAARGSISFLGDPYQFPNIRRIFVPDPGRTWFDLDLERADLHVVCWEAEDQLLKQAMRLGVDIHLLNAYVLLHREPPPWEELVEGHPKYPDHLGPLKHMREFAKVFCHGSDYGGSSRTMAVHTGRTVHEIDRAQAFWFSAHPGIKRWHTRVADQIRKYHWIENRFGYRWFIFDRLDGAFTEALAWVPQSTVSVAINRAWNNIFYHVPEVEVLMQSHDSLAGQMETGMVEILVPRIKSESQIIVPYEDPLIIPASIKLSDVSWGDC